MADIDLVLGAKNKTEPAFQGVNKSMERLQGRARSATKTMARVADPGMMNRFAASTRKSVGSIATSFQRLKAAAGPLLAIWAAIKTVKGAVAAVSAVNEAFDTQTEAVEGLNTSLRVNGEEVEQNSQRLQSFASEMQSLTGVGDEVTLALMKQASMLGIQSDKLDDAAQAAIGLSEATGQSLETSLQSVQKAMQGDFGSLQELIPALREAQTEEEKLALVTEMARKGFEAKTEAGDRLAGMVEKANGAWGDMMERVGELLAPLRMLLAKGVKALAETMQDLLVPMIEKVNSAFETVQPVIDAVIEHIQTMMKVWGEVASVILEILKDAFGSGLKDAGESFASFADQIRSWSLWLVEKVVSAITVIEVAWENMPAVFALVVNKAKLSFETMRADVEHVFTRVLPSYAIWFVTNFRKILADGFNATVTVVKNFGESLGMAFIEIFKFIRSGMEGGLAGLTSRLSGIASKNLLDGFKATVGSLPEVAARALTEREVQLQEKVGGIGRMLGEEFTNKFTARMDRIGKALGDQVKSAPDPDLSGGEKVSRGTGTTLQATESRLLTRGATEDPLNKVAQNSEKTVATLKSIDDRIKEQNEANQQNANQGGAIQFEVIG